MPNKGVGVVLYRMGARRHRSTATPRLAVAPVLLGDHLPLLNSLLVVQPCAYSRKEIDNMRARPASPAGRPGVACRASSLCTFTFILLSRKKETQCANLFVFESPSSPLVEEVISSPASLGCHAVWESSANP